MIIPKFSSLTESVEATAVVTSQGKPLVPAKMNGLSEDYLDRLLKEQKPLFVTEYSDEARPYYRYQLLNKKSDKEAATLLTVSNYLIVSIHQVPPKAFTLGISSFTLPDGNDIAPYDVESLVNATGKTKAKYHRLSAGVINDCDCVEYTQYDANGNIRISQCADIETISMLKAAGKTMCTVVYT